MARGELPDYPWDLMGPYRDRAASHPDGIVDLSIGSPVDPTPAIVREALAVATDAHAYPTTVGTPELRAEIVRWFARRRGVPGLTEANVLPTIVVDEPPAAKMPPPDAGPKLREKVLLRTSSKVPFSTAIPPPLPPID